MDNIKFTQCKPGTVFICDGYLAVYTGSWLPFMDTAKLQVFKLDKTSNFDAEKIFLHEISDTISRDKIFTIGDPVKLHNVRGTAFDFDEEFVHIAIRDGKATTKKPYHRLIAMNKSYALKAYEEQGGGG